MKELVSAAKAFADSTRVRVLRALLPQELCVCELCDVLGATQSTLSTHLQVIREAGLVTTRKEGKWIYYGIDPQKKVIVTALFKSFEEDLTTDAVIRADGRRLQKRLNEREDGACCRGFAATRATCN